MINEPKRCDVSVRRVHMEDRRKNGSDSRKEGGTAVSGGAVLEVEAEVVAADERLEAGAELRVAVVLAEFNRLVHGPVSVAEVGREGVPEMDAQAFCRAGRSMIGVRLCARFAERFSLLDSQPNGLSVVDDTILVQ